MIQSVLIIVGAHSQVVRYFYVETNKVQTNDLLLFPIMLRIIKK